MYVHVYARNTATCRVQIDLHAKEPPPSPFIHFEALPFWGAYCVIGELLLGGFEPFSHSTTAWEIWDEPGAACHATPRIAIQWTKLAMLEEYAEKRSAQLSNGERWKICSICNNALVFFYFSSSMLY